MSDILLDLKKNSTTYGDLILEKGDLVITPDQGTAIQQHILQRLRTYFGEWFMDTTIGINYFGQILTKNPDQGVIDGILIKVILDTPGVVELLSYSATPNFASRSLSVTFSVQTTKGKVNYEGNLI